MLIGQGPLMEEIKEKVNNFGLNDCVIFLGQKDNVNEYYNAMDLFLFPSLYEGLGMVVIEAQVNGLPCIVSDEVPKIAKISDNIKFISIKDSGLKWVSILEDLNNSSRNKSNNTAFDKYDIKLENIKLTDFYLSSLNKRESFK